MRYVTSARDQSESAEQSGVEAMAAWVRYGKFMINTAKG